MDTISADVKLGYDLVFISLNAADLMEYIQAESQTLGDESLISIKEAVEEESVIKENVQTTKQPSH